MGDFDHELSLLVRDSLCLPHLQQAFTQVADLSQQLSITNRPNKHPGFPGW